MEGVFFDRDVLFAGQKLKIRKIQLKSLYTMQPCKGQSLLFGPLQIRGSFVILCRFFDKNRTRESEGFWLVVSDDGRGLCLARSRMQGGQSDSMTVPDQRPMPDLLPCELLDGQHQGSIQLVFPLELRPDAARRRRAPARRGRRRNTDDAGYLIKK